MPYSEVELAAARDVFLSPANFDETDPTRFYLLPQLLFS
jgi:hypothetical protein